MYHRKESFKEDPGLSGEILSLGWFGKHYCVGREGCWRDGGLVISDPVLEKQQRMDRWMDGW